MLTIEPCQSIPLHTIDAALYDDPRSALSAVVESAVAPTPHVLSEIRRVAEDMPLLQGKALHYAELSRDRLAKAYISAKDMQAIESVFFEYPAFVVLADPPILFINHEELKAQGGAEIQIQILHHELVHAEQAIRGDSQATEEGQIWKGELYENDKLYGMNQGVRLQHPGAVYSYLCLPWEEEAFRRSEGNEAYEKKRMDAAIRSLFHNLQDARLVDRDRFLPEDYRVAFLMMCGEAIEPGREPSELPAETFDAYDSMLADLHIGLGKAGTAALRDLLHATIQKGGHEVPFPVERSPQEVGIHLYLACLVWLNIESA